MLIHPKQMTYQCATMLDVHIAINFTGDNFTGEGLAIRLDPFWISLFILSATPRLGTPTQLILLNMEQKPLKLHFYFQFQNSEQLINLFSIFLQILTKVYLTH